MKCVINDQVVLSRPPDGPVAAHIGAFAESRTALGCARDSIQREVRLAAGFSHWLKREGITLPRIGTDHGSRYLRHRARRVRPGLGDAAALRHFLEFLRHEGVIVAEKVAARRLTPAERWAQLYAEYLCEARALARPTVVNYVPFIRGFLTPRDYSILSGSWSSIARLSSRRRWHSPGHNSRRTHNPRSGLGA